MKYLIFLIVLLSLSFAQKQQYNDFTVIRFNQVTADDVDHFFSMKTDVWATDLMAGWADVMLHNQQVDYFITKYSNYTVVLPNVQDELDRSEKELEGITSPNIFDHFPTITEVEDWMDDTFSTHPQVAKNIDIGRTAQGRLIRGLLLGFYPTSPYIYIHCTIHAREWITTPTCAYIVDTILNTDVYLLEDFNWVIVPVLNIDGYVYSHSNDRLWRKNRQTNSGSSCIGTDLNRNYGVAWGGSGSSPYPCDEIYRGASAFSAPETAAERTYIQNLINGGATVSAYVDIHSYGAYFMCPWGYTTARPADYSAMNSFMITATNAIRGVNGRSYQYGSSAVVLYAAAGGSDDWAYGSEGVVASFTVECAGNNFTPPVSAIGPVAREVYAGIKALAGAISVKQ